MSVGAGRRFARGLALWTAIGLFFASEAAIRQFPGQARRLPWLDALLINIPFYLIWGALSLVVLALARRFPLRDAKRWRNVGVHVLFALTAALLQLVLAEGFFELVRLWRGNPTTFRTALAFSVQHNLHVNFLTYWAIVAVKMLRDSDRGLRERRLVESRLREELARAELSALRMQLHPHFLFNALHSISALLDTDPVAADAMLMRLSDLLRRSLERRSEAEVSLGRELDFVRTYLELTGMRYGERLRAEVSVSPGLLSAMVPTFLLQPLVENAVLHGVETSVQPCRVSVRAYQEGSRLVLEVENDLGPLPDARARGEAGLGIANVRARLVQFAEEETSFDLDLEPGRRALARILLPFRETRRTELGTDGELVEVS